MKKIYFLALTLFLFTSINAQNITIPDSNFKLKLLDANSANVVAKNLQGAYFKIDSNNDNEIDNSEALQVSELNLNGSTISDISEISYISDLDGIQYFVNLKTLDCSYNTITYLNLSTLVNINSIDCKGNLITSLNINGLANLNSVDCKSNLITSLNLIGLSNLESLICNDNKISKLNLTGLTKLKTLDCGLNILTSLDLRDLISLTDLWCQDNNLFSLFIKNGSNENLNDINGNPNLSYICLDEFQRSSVKILVEDLNYTNCVLSNDCDASEPIVSIPDSKFKTKLLQADSSHFIAETITGIPIKIDANYDGEIQVNEALNVVNLDLSNSGITNLSGIEYFTNLVILECGNNVLTKLDISKLINLESLDCRVNQLSDLDVTKLKKLTSLNCKENLLISLKLAGLANLKYIECQENKLVGLDLTTIVNLIYIDCFANKLASLNITHLNNLESLNCNTNNITALDLNGLINITSFFCAENLLSTLDITGLNNLRYLGIWNNQITTIDLSGSLNLISLYGGNNPIKSFDFSKVPNLQNLWCGYTSINTLDVSNLKTLTGINVSGCPNLESINLKNGSFEGLTFYEKQVADLHLDGKNFSNCPKINYICGDETEIDFISQKISSYNYVNCVVGNYCSFSPGGNNYTIGGNIHIDSNNNGCDASDLKAANIKFNIYNGDLAEDFIANETGKYALNVQQGFYTITPLIENPEYFTISPSAINIDCTGEITSFSQDFCIASVGSHDDLEITFIALDEAKSGLDAKYKIVYKNKGTNMQSGTVNLVFNDAVLDLTSTIPSVSNYTANNLSWAFSNLAPLESREISIVFNLNSPLELPAVNNGDILNYTATINSLKKDETINDNTKALSQKVTSSNNSNDKTCLEGDVITPSLIGEYVNYLIRFENTGTYPAQNIVVKDLIDLTKFDISTLVPTKASHEFTTKISNGNKVEFIFENINLPFENATNDGYIAFKIKTLPTLVVGDSFANEATIYFDYNFPVLTNKATSVFKTLGTQDFEFTDYFSLYPNPVTDILNIGTSNNIEVQSMAIYDILGQLVIVVPNAQTISKIDVSKLTTGNYFLKMNTDKGTSSMKLIKK